MSVVVTVGVTLSDPGGGFGGLIDGVNCEVYGGWKIMMIDDDKGGVWLFGLCVDLCSWWDDPDQTHSR